MECPPLPPSLELYTTCALEHAPQTQLLGFHHSLPSTWIRARPLQAPGVPIARPALTAAAQEHRETTTSSFPTTGKDDDDFVDELQLLNIHDLEHWLLNDWNVNNLVHETTDESASESQSRNCSLSELDCRKLLLHVQRVSRLSSKRHDLRELVSACS